MMNEINLARADLNLLALFEVIFSERHLGRAAARLNLTASAVSHGLSRLRRLLNDPLFLRVPKGVVPTARAMALADPIADVLARARNVLATAAPFDPAKSQRRFVIGAPDGISPVFLTPLLATAATRCARHRHRIAAIVAAERRPVARAGVDTRAVRARTGHDGYRGGPNRPATAAFREPDAV